MAKFSELLYELRKEKNLTQSDLAEKLGITNKAVSKWETGEAMPDTAQLLPLAEILGVSVDELLRGERADAPSAPPAPSEEEKKDGEGEKSSVRFSKGKNTVEISSKGIFINSPEAEERMEEDAWHFSDEEDGEKCGHCGVYINGKHVVRKMSLPEKISGCVCASLIAIAILSYILLGCFLKLWHPLWCIPASAALACGIVGCIADMFDRAKIARKKKKGENPYTGSICGIIMCACLIVFLCVASVLNLWNILWVIPVAGVCVCIIVGTIGGILGSGKKKDGGENS